MNRTAVAKELLRLAKDLVGMDFPSQDAMNEYLKAHPGANRSKHRVVEPKKTPAATPSKSVHPHVQEFHQFARSNHLQRTPDGDNTYKMDEKDEPWMKADLELNGWKETGSRGSEWKKGNHTITITTITGTDKFVKLS